MSHMYAIARQLQVSGVRTVATFNPTRLTTTIRNMARKSIASGYHTGGWSSKTRDVRDLIFSLAGEKPIVYVAQGADLKKAQLVRQKLGSDKPDVLNVDLEQILQKGNQKLNVAVEPGDLIYIPSKRGGGGFNVQNLFMALQAATFLGLRVR